MWHRRLTMVLAAGLLLATAANPQSTVAGSSPAESPAPEAGSYDARLLKGIEWRVIGPFRGGRALAVTGVRGEPYVYYMGSVSGGVWKTIDGGETWTPLTDHESVSSIGSIAVPDSDPNVIYVGTGEGCPRGDVTYGNGVWKSLDGGKTWVHLGLEQTETIPRIIVNPRDPNEVFVAALGHIFGPNADRGVYKSSDGGKTWKKVLYKDERTGAVDVTFDPSNPHVLFAALWEMNRTPYSLTSGGPGSGLYKSTDDGETWKQLEAHGLPKGIWGRVGVSVSRADSNRVYALIEAAEGGLYRSDDGGDTWTRINGDHKLWQRAWYYMHVLADPKSADTLYVLDVSMQRSTDGGKTFSTLHPPHGDTHGLWIDPDDPRRLINGSDGGATISVDGGQTWSSLNNQPTAQFYHVIADDKFPYHVYGAQQDNTTIAIATSSDQGAIDLPDYYSVGGGESGYVAPYPPDPDIVYAGDYEGGVDRYNKHSEQVETISPWPVITDGGGAAGLKYRAQWTAPLVISPHDPNVIYWGAQVIMKSRDAGKNWTAISPDLTRNDKSKQQVSGGPIMKDDTGTEYYDTVFTIAESPVQKDLIWAGSDDGLVHVTTDGGRNWSDVTPKEMPEWSMVSLIEASPHDANTAYVAIDRHRLDDHQPYAYRTTDLGRTWTRITDGIPSHSYVHAVREDPVRKGLLYAGTETGVMVSFDDGAHWQSLQLNLPASPVHDLATKNGDLIAATHGRSFWVLDDVSPLRELSPEVGAKAAWLFKPRPAFQTQIHHRPSMGRPVGENPPTGATLYYYLNTAPKEGEEITLQVLDSQGHAVREYSSRKEASEEPAEAQEEELEEGTRTTSEPLPSAAGLNRFNWDLRYEPAVKVPGYSLWDYEEGIEGPRALPGTYQLRLTAAGQTLTEPLEVKLDPRVTASAEDLKQQFELATAIHQKLSQLDLTVNQIRSLRTQLQRLDRELSGNPEVREVLTASTDLKKKLTGVEEKLINPRIAADEDSVSFAVQIDAKLAALEEAVESALSAPTQGSREAYADLSRQLDEQLAAWQGIEAKDVTAFNALARREKVQAIVIPAAASEGSATARK
jgi:photosystem II stability/assembly factor-like uncharacterized protein